MTESQLGVNTSVVIDEAARLESAGYQGNAVAFVEQLLLRAFTSGYRPLEPPPTPRGPGSTDEGRERARRIYESTRREKETVK